MQFHPVASSLFYSYSDTIGNTIGEWFKAYELFAVFHI